MHDRVSLLVAALLGGALLVAGLAASAAAQAPSSSTARWRFSPGERFTYHTTVVSTTTRGNGDPQRTTHEIHARWTIESVDGDTANATVEVVRTRYRDRLNRYDSETTTKAKETGRFGRMVKRLKALAGRKMKVAIDTRGVVRPRTVADGPRFFVQHDACRLAAIFPEDAKAATWEHRDAVFRNDTAVDTFAYRLTAGAPRTRLEYRVTRADTNTEADVITGTFKSLEGDAIGQFDGATGRLCWLRETRLETREIARRNRKTPRTRRVVTVVRLVPETPPTEPITIALEAFEGTCMCALNGKSMGRLPRALEKLRERITGLGPKDAAVSLRATPDVRHVKVRQLLDLCTELGCAATLDFVAIEGEG